MNCGESTPARIVFDTSTLVSAVLIEDSIPYRALLLAFDLYEVCTSEQTLAELSEVLTRPRFENRITLQARMDFRILFVEAETMVIPVCRDAKDNKFLALAAAAEAEAIISSDKDLLVLDPWNGIAILTPAEFLA